MSDKELKADYSTEFPEYKEQTSYFVNKPKPEIKRRHKREID